MNQSLRSIAKSAAVLTFKKKEKNKVCGQWTTDTVTDGFNTIREDCRTGMITSTVFIILLTKRRNVAAAPDSLRKKACSLQPEAQETLE